MASSGRRLAEAEPLYTTLYLALILTLINGTEPKGCARGIESRLWGKRVVACGV